ncbi:MAG: LysM peptidoglycan-binding domain-containing protein [Pseudomonadota bacterium]
MKRSAIAIAGLAALGVALLAYWQFGKQGEAEDPQQTAQSAETGDTVPETAVNALAPEPVVEETPPEETATSSETVEVEAVTEQADAAIAPKFDVVRVDPEGQAVVAGRATPGAAVEILVDGEIVATETADASGNFVSLFKIAKNRSARQLVLRAAGVESDETAVAAAATGAIIGDEDAPEPGATTNQNAAGAPETPGDQSEVALTTTPVTGETQTLEPPENLNPGAVAGDLPAPDTVAGQVSTEAGEGSAADQIAGASDTVILLPGAEQGDAPLLVQPGSEGLALLQPAETSVEGVRLDRISYSAGGDLNLLGRAVPGNTIRVYVNAELNGEAIVIPAGQWRAVIGVAAARTAQLLRFDEVDAAGDVVSRIETPFSYEAESGPKTLSERQVKIAKGDYLWRIAENYYGEGIRYSLIFSANSDLIRDPDLIYPGQVFTVPELVDSQ